MRIRSLAFFTLLIVNHAVHAHGSMEIPISRIYSCYKEGPEKPTSSACIAAVQAGGTQALYDWNGINQANANDQHQRVIPDGTLCAGGKSLFKGMNLPRSDWNTTTVIPNANGQYDFYWLVTAAHAAKYFKFYLTKDNYSFTSPLKWSDLDEPFCTITSVVLANNRYKMTCTLPKKTGRRILYVIWQRSDSTEAFYSCSDIVLGNGGDNTTSWKQLSAITAHNDLEQNTKIQFRLFKNGIEAETHSIIATGSQTQAQQWPYALATFINSQSSLVKMGQMNTSGQITPVVSATLNNIYINTDNISPYASAIDFTVPNDNYDYIYPNGISTYKAGTIVLGRDQLRYQCKPWPNSGWCSQAPLYYEPGRGLAWRDAWIQLSTG